ncbi:hypothetical protein CZ765_06695 [Corynebacterium casei]|nr:hypothetical protein CZ765_06695 [Corynebacterium casei]
MNLLVISICPEKARGLAPEFMSEDRQTLAHSKPWLYG